jgi:hypothetical protein
MPLAKGITIRSGTCLEYGGLKVRRTILELIEIPLMSVAKKIIIMLLLKTAPEDLPYSTGLMGRVIFLYFISGIVVVSDTVELSLAMGHMLLNISIILFFSYVVLSSLNLKTRFVQMVTAMIGTGIIFNLLAWPVLSYNDIEQASEFAQQLFLLVVLMLVSWEVLVTAHIFRNALNTKMTQAVILSMALFFVSLTLSQLVFPESS